MNEVLQPIIRVNTLIQTTDIVFTLDTCKLPISHSDYSSSDMGENAKGLINSNNNYYVLIKSDPLNIPPYISYDKNLVDFNVYTNTVTIKRNGINSFIPGEYYYNFRYRGPPLMGFNGVPSFRLIITNGPSATITPALLPLNEVNEPFSTLSDVNPSWKCKFK